MDTNREHPDIASIPDIVAVLIDFARLTQHIPGRSTPESHNTSAHLLLLRLLSLCGLQRGALLLSTQYHTETQQSFWSSLAERKTLRILARHKIDEDDLPTLLKTFSNHQDGDRQMVLCNADWLICQHSISVPGSSTHYNGSTEPFNAPFSATLRFFLLGETERQTQAALEQEQTVWPLVADAVGTVIVSQLQAEHLHDMEMEMHHRDLQQMELLKAELLAAVSHELRSPLTSVKGYAATLLRHERRISREERHEFLLAIHDASQRLESVTDRLLKMSQLETASVPLQLSPVDLAYIVREAISVKKGGIREDDSASTAEPPPQHDSSVPQTKCSFVVHIEDTHGYSTHNVPLIYADRRLLREVLDHLLENAMQYSPEGGMVEIGLRMRGPEQMYRLSQELAHPSGIHRSPIVFPPTWTPNQPALELWVQDHGVGIAETHLQQIFQRFYRVDISLTRAVNGLGLGLTICQQIIALHDGLLWVESEEGKGSTFHVLLPIDESAIS